jgi:hypothetical protein
MRRCARRRCCLRRGPSFACERRGGACCSRSFSFYGTRSRPRGAAAWQDGAAELLRTPRTPSQPCLTWGNDLRGWLLPRRLLLVRGLRNSTIRRNAKEAIKFPSGGMSRIEALGDLCLTFAKSVCSRGLTRQSARTHMLPHKIVLAWTVALSARSQLSRDSRIWHSLRRHALRPLRQTCEGMSVPHEGEDGKSLYPPPHIAASSASSPPSSCTGRGGQPRMCRSTGTTLSTAPTTA